MRCSQNISPSKISIFSILFKYCLLFLFRIFEQKETFIFKYELLIGKSLLSILIAAVKQMRSKIVVEHLTNLQQSLQIRIYKFVVKHKHNYNYNYNTKYITVVLKRTPAFFYQINASEQFHSFYSETIVGRVWKKAASHDIFTPYKRVTAKMRCKNYG